MAENGPAPIIVKRKKVVGGDGHHGGAWKVAYADFVTAMMAFFLLMWLLNATTEKQRKGLADYFAPSVPMAAISGGGDGAFYGDSVFTEDSLAESGRGASLEHPTEADRAEGSIDRPDGPNTTNGPERSMAEQEELLETLMARGGESMAELLRQRHVVTRLSDIGLVFDIHETEGVVLFDPKTNAPTKILKDTIAAIAYVSQMVTNEVSVDAHLPARPVVIADNPVWDISTTRAQGARAALEEAGMEPRRIQRVTGFADRQPIHPDAMHRRNNRVEITLLRDDV